MLFRSSISLVLMFVGFLVFTISLNIHAQEVSQSKDAVIVDNQSVKLKKKLLLTEEQTQAIKKVLRSNIEELKAGDLASAIKAIYEVLDSKQKVKFEIIENDWVKELTKSLQGSAEK